MNDLTHYEYTDRKGITHLVENLPQGPGPEQLFGGRIVIDSTLEPGTAEFRDPETGRVLARIKNP